MVDVPCAGILGVVADGEEHGPAGSAPSSIAMIVAMRAVLHECSATGSGFCTSAIHHPVRAVFFSVPADDARAQLYHCLQAGELFDEHIAFSSELAAAA